MTASATSHFAHESSGPGGKLYWSERRDGHWHADAPGGHFDVVPMARGYHLWWRGKGASYVDLGHHGSLGQAFAGARYYLDEGVPARTAAEGVKAAEEGSKACCGDANCAHRHPPTVPSLPCSGANETNDQILARRKTFDNELVQFWTNGDVTVGHEMSNKYIARRLPKDLALIVADDVSLYDADEVPKLIKAARKAWDMHKREPYRVRLQDVRGVMRAYGPKPKTETKASEASLSEAPSPMHIEIPADAYAQWVAYGDAMGPVDTTEKIYKLLSGYAHKQDQEVFLVVVTDLHFKLRSVTEVARGERSSVGVGIEEVMRATLMTPGVAHMCCAHQHPTGKCRPSKADRDLHRSIEEASKSYASLTYLDHVVIGVGEYHSIREGKTYKVKS